MSFTGSRNARLTLNNANLPRRVRSILLGLMEFSSQELERILAASLNEFEQQLFKHADQARNPAVQTKWLDAQRQVKRTRADVIPRFLIALESELATLRNKSEEKKQETMMSNLRGLTLSLVESSEMDENTVIMEIATRSEMRCSLQLYLLGQRFGVLAASPAYDAETLPLGPHSIIRMMRTSVESLELNNEHRVLFYRVFDRHFTLASEAFFEAISNNLVRNGILPTLQYVPTRVRRAEQAGDTAAVEETTDNDGSNSAQIKAQEAKALAAKIKLEPMTPGGSGASGGSGGSSNTPVPAAKIGFDIPEMNVPFSTSLAPLKRPELGAGLNKPDGNIPSGEDLFSLLHGLMAGRRQLLGKLGQAGAIATNPNAPSATNEQLQMDLRKMQAQPVRMVNADGKTVPRNISHIKQDLMLNMRESNPQNPPNLSESDNDTIDLLGMLFDHIMKDVKPNSPASILLSKLQVPLIRIALQDKTFFTYQQHPARNMLNTVAEAGAHWLGDDDYDPSLLKKLQSVVDRTVREFDDDPKLFGDLHEDINQHLQTLNRKAEVAERRYVEAARGKEKLTLSRERASEAVENLLKTHTLPRFTHTLLSQAWTDVMALTALRQGEGSDSWKQQLKIAERLIQISRAPSAEGARITPELERLKQEVQDSLGHVGYQGDEAEAIANRLVMPNSGTEGDSASRTELTMRMKNRTRLGQDVKAQRESHEKLAPEERARYDQIKQCAFGTWFEFVINQQGDVARRRMSWFSTITGNALFVNQRGQKVGDYTLDQLAKLMARGQLRIVEENQGNLIDRAWGAVVSALRTFVGRNDEAEVK